MKGCVHADAAASGISKARSLLLNARLCLRRYQVAEAESLIKRADRALALVETCMREEGDCKLSRPPEGQGILHRVKNIFRSQRGDE